MVHTPVRVICWARALPTSKTESSLNGILERSPDRTTDYTANADQSAEPADERKSFVRESFGDFSTSSVGPYSTAIPPSIKRTLSATPPTNPIEWEMMIIV